MSPISTPVDLAPGSLQLQQVSEERTRAERKPDKVPDEKIQISPSVANLPEALSITQPKLQPTEAPVVASAQAASIAQPDVTAPPAAAQLAAQAATPAPGQTPSQSSQVIATWQRQLAVHLQRFKRYPPNASGAQGIATVTFIIDRAGRVTEVHIFQSSGSPALDAEAIANIKRAEPFPAPPTGIADAFLSFSVPIRYVTAGR